MNKQRFAVIVAGGIGSRAGAGIPKQFVELAGVPMIFHTLRAFADYDRKMKIVVVMNGEYMDVYARMCREREFDVPHSIVEGGATRAESVRNGLAELGVSAAEGALDSNVAVAIHDAARPLVSRELIERGFDAVEEGMGVVPVVKAVNSLRRIISHGDGGRLSTLESRSVDRNDYVEVQTPQIFLYRDIWEAYGEAEDLKRFTDDASVAEAAGMKIGLFEGDHRNIKVTTPEDFMIAETLLRMEGIKE